MKKNIKLLLLAALAWPGIAMAQGQVTGSLQKSVETSAIPIPIMDKSNVESGDDISVPFVDSFARGGVKGKVATTRIGAVSSAPKTVPAPRKNADPDAPAIFVQVDRTALGVGTSNLKYVPFDATYIDSDNTEAQMIYTAEKLASMGLTRGAVIKSFTFFVDTQTTTSVPTAFGGATYQVRIGETAMTSIATYDEMVSNRNSLGSPVFSGNLPTGDTQVTFTLDNPIVYNGGNIMIDTYVSSKNTTFADCYWLGETQQTASCFYYHYDSKYPNDAASDPTTFLPKIQFDYVTWDAAEEIDFGDVLIDATKTLQARISNPTEGTMAVNMSSTQPFGVTPSALIMQPGMNDFTLTFSPKQSINYTGKLTLDIDGHVANVDMKGVGFKAGEKAVRDEAFFHNITYDWTDSNGKPHTSTLDSIATDPDQIIAMLRKVYMDPTIPGNFKRGYSANGGEDSNVDGVDNNVQYTGAGTIIRSNGTYRFDDTYGWNIPSNNALQTGSKTINYRSYAYAYMDPSEYKPKYEGVTLLLLEMVDNFNPNSVTITQTGGYAELRNYFAQVIKSARLVTQAKRTGSGFDAGTLFKIDCDKMNKFYLIAKGQLAWQHSVVYETQSTSFMSFYPEPCYLYGGSYNLYSDKAITKYFFLGHMFEQFSPALSNSTVTKSDIYQELAKNMESFGVDHDCPNVPFVQNGHHFMMYGEDSSSDDCQDVRDMMFFVPDYRMMYHNERGKIQTDGSWTQDYFKYNPAHQPTMGMFVIVQNEIPQGEICGPDNSLYKHQLEWKSSLNKFLPSDDQYYELWEVVINAYGIEEYVPVYERNADGSYVLDENGEKKQVILNRSAKFGSDDKNNDILHYLDVYVDRKEGSQTKTYVIRGRDKGDENGEPFLSLEMSNRQSIVIPGLDPNEKVRMIGTTHYSRYNPKDETNCYSNKLQIVDNSLTEDDLTGDLTFTRSYLPALVDENGNVQTDEDGNILYATEAESVTFATGSYSNGTLTITINPETQAASDKFPEVKNKTGEGFDRYLDVAGYHANPVDGNNQMTIDVEIKGGKVSFTDFKVWDNFTADVSENEHPYRYLYKIYMGEAYSNDVPVMVYKTDSKINGAVTLQDVLDDSDMGLPAPGDVEFQAQVQFGSKTELLRYDAYRWQEADDKRYIVTQVGVNEYGNDIETDVAPDGQANNESSYYTVRMNDYYSDQVPVSDDNPRGWAKFVDKYPAELDNADAFVYAPVVETFNFGYRENKENNKLAERNDYNTYGGPMQNTAVGKLKVEAYQPTEQDKGTERALMSDTWWGTWTGDGETGVEGKRYSYYNIFLNFEALGVPAGYELYKVRAWRKIDKKDLGELLPTRRAVRIGNIDENGWYMYEDMNFGDQLDLRETPARMSCNELSKNTILLGERSSKIAKPMNPGDETAQPLFETETSTSADGTPVPVVVEHEFRATFGARRLNVPGEDNGFDKLVADFKVRAYFTRGDNPLIGGASSSNAPRRAGAELTPADYDYYVAEGECHFEQLGGSGVITGITGVKADLNREVMGVNYVNTMGQVSNRPWQGVNVVVTRYTDGTTKTTKAVF